MTVDEIDFGSEDARNLRLRTDEEKKVFLSSYVLPSKFKLEDFLEGYKYFVFGGKGAGKTALLQYIRIRAEIDLEAESMFFYFQSSFSKDELRAFLANHAKENGQVIDDRDLYDADESALFWRLFLLAQAAKLLKKAGIQEGAADEFAKLVESAKLISQAKNIGKKYPNLQKFSVTLSKNPQFQLDGTFENATVGDLSIYLQLSEEKLEEIYLDRTPLFIFVDEMEVYLKGDETDAFRLSAVASLVRAVRDFNERFYHSHIRVIAAIRDAVVDQVSSVQGEIYRIIRDNGVQLDWPGTVQMGLHPLEKMILGRIVAQDKSFEKSGKSGNDSSLYEALTKYFPGNHILRKCLNLTWYRPRDVALLFEEASTIDKGKSHFSPYTLSDGVVKALGKRLWQDAISGLAVKYNPMELNGIDRILRGGNEYYSKSSLIARMDELSDMYEDVAILSDNKWITIIEDLYQVGAIYCSSVSSGNKNFCFRGDAMPSLSKDFSIGVHRVLFKELSIRT
ncbi:hypothetical protein M2305_002251 [Gluconobacter cerinus]|uniref:P-loop ATPase, Sll1717 family n=1 Tax=Gluconobacter cerinus TaxID=38307 RepID=UPI002226FBE5|nr:hypothetical protein [Gluconobacter cerinus]MCW2266304.1 hypothetical protein [Gluconobacter cerinus]